MSTYKEKQRAVLELAKVYDYIQHCIKSVKYRKNLKIEYRNQRIDGLNTAANMIWARMHGLSCFESYEEIKEYIKELE